MFDEENDMEKTRLAQMCEVILLPDQSSEQSIVTYFRQLSKSKSSTMEELTSLRNLVSELQTRLTETNKMSEQSKKEIRELQLR